MSCTELFLDCKVESMCRACLSVAGELESLHENNKAQLFCECTSLRVVEMDGLSPYLCRSCHVKLQEYYNFRQLCHQSDAIMRNKLYYLSSQDKYDSIINNESEPVKAEPELREKITFSSNKKTGNYYESEKASLVEKQKKNNRYPEYDDCNESNDYTENNYLDDDQCSIKEENKLVKYVLLICDICKESFKCKAQLKKHIHIHNEKEQDGGGNNMKIITSIDNTESNNVHSVFSLDNKSESNPQKCFKCDICPKVFKTDGLPYQKHLKRHSNSGKINLVNDECQVNEIDLKLLPNNKRKYTRHQKQRKVSTKNRQKITYSLACPKCNRRFGNQQIFEDHLRSHEGLPALNFTCTICNKELKYKSLAPHMELHSTEKKYKCPTCQESFLTYPSLLRHKRNHLEFVKYVCHICGHKSKQKGQFKDHLTKHTGEKPYPCDVCDKRFRFSSECREHKMRHRGIKRFCCTKCPKTFWVKQSLNAHLKSHSDARPYSCEICGKTYKSQTFSVVHRLSHTGERPFECDRCSMKFTRNTYLKRHYMTHTGEKPKQCTICSKTFIEKSTLNKHMKKHHKDIAPTVQ